MTRLPLTPGETLVSPENQSTATPILTADVPGAQAGIDRPLTRRELRERERAQLEGEVKLVPAAIANAAGPVAAGDAAANVDAAANDSAASPIAEATIVATNLTLAAILASDAAGKTSAVETSTAEVSAAEAEPTAVQAAVETSRPMTRRERRLAEQEAAAQAEASTAVAENPLFTPVVADADLPTVTPDPTEGDDDEPAAAQAEPRELPVFSRRVLRDNFSLASQPLPVPVAAPSHEAAPVAASTSRRSASKAKTFGRNVFSVSAMAFVAAMALATSVPANALLSASDVAAQKVESRTEDSASRGTNVAAAQSLEGDGASIAPSARDSFGAKSLDEVVALSRMKTASTYTNDPNGSIQWPFPVGVPVSDWFGYRSEPTPGMHHGVDFTPGEGTPVHVIADGVVRYVGTNPNDGLGIHVIVDHQIDGQTVSSVYAHMQVGSPPVVEGQQVKVTDIVGKVGDTGFSTGPHLHFEIRLNGTRNTDPFAWMQAHAN